MKSIIVALLVLFLLLFVAPAASAQWDCEADVIYAYAVADTIYVQHLNAERNCCATLAVDMVLEESIVNFYEAETGEFCTCMCCFNLDYDANGFAAGHYVVRVWNHDGSEFYGEAEVNVDRNGLVPMVANLDRGECLTPAEVEEPWPVFEDVSWGRIRTGYR